VVVQLSPLSGDEPVILSFVPPTQSSAWEKCKNTNTSKGKSGCRPEVIKAGSAVKSRSVGRSPVGLHCLGFLADTTQQAADDFYPGHAHMFTKIGQERGWPPTTRAQFDATRGPTGAFLIGDAETVAEKILRINEALGGISRLNFQMTSVAVPYRKMMRAIEILGTQVAPLVRRELTPASVPL